VTGKRPRGRPRGTQAKKHTLMMAIGGRRPMEPRAQGLGHPTVDHTVELWLNLFYKQPSFMEWEGRGGKGRDGKKRVRRDIYKCEAKAEPEGWKEPGPVAAPGVCSASRLSAAGGEAASRTDVVPATRQPCVALLALPAFPSCFILYEQPVPATVSCTFLSPESELCFQS